MIWPATPWYPIHECAGRRGRCGPRMRVRAPSVSSSPSPLPTASFPRTPHACGSRPRPAPLRVCLSNSSDARGRRLGGARVADAPGLRRRGPAWPWQVSHGARVPLSCAGALPGFASPSLAQTLACGAVPLLACVARNQHTSLFGSAAALLSPLQPACLPLRVP